MDGSAKRNSERRFGAAEGGSARGRVAVESTRLILIRVVTLMQMRSIISWTLLRSLWDLSSISAIFPGLESSNRWPFLLVICSVHACKIILNKTNIIYEAVCNLCFYLCLATMKNILKIKSSVFYI